MRNNKGITLTILIITIVILAILASAITFTIGNTYEGSNLIQFESYMKIIQKQVDVVLEEGTNYEQMGQALSSDIQARLQAIIDADTQNLIQTTDVTSNKLRYFSSEDIDNYFDIIDINDEVVVNFENREVISLNGVEKDNIMHYVENGL